MIFPRARIRWRRGASLGSKHLAVYPYLPPPPAQSIHHRLISSDLDPPDPGEHDQEFILSILQASPSKRDSRTYLSSFQKPLQNASTSSSSAKPEPNIVSHILNPVLRRPALVKIQGPFTDVQLDSIARGMANLRKLGLVSVIVVDRDDIPPEPKDSAVAQRQRTLVLRDLERVVYFLGRHRAAARPILATVAAVQKEGTVVVEEEGLDHIRRAVEEGEIPVLLPVALDDGCRSRRVGANAVIAAMTRAMVTIPTSTMLPMRLLIINREGGIPSYARSGLPHLSINLASEYNYINSTFLPAWRASHPTALSNLNLANACLKLLPREASALVISHRSPAALIGNLITNKPAHSASLPHALLEAGGRLTRDTPTLIRKGLPVRIIRSMQEVDREKLKELLETSFGQTLSPRYFKRLERHLDFVIVVGDYAGAAVVTLEGLDEEGVEGGSRASTESGSQVQRLRAKPTARTPRNEPICYLDKFAVNPRHQGDGTSDFLFVALRDETYGLGLPDSANPTAGSLTLSSVRSDGASAGEKGGDSGSGSHRGSDTVTGDRSRNDDGAGAQVVRGKSRDLVWRSRGDNIVNKWYFERSSGFIRVDGGKWVVFWCDKEERRRGGMVWSGDDGGGGEVMGGGGGGEGGGGGGGVRDGQEDGEGSEYAGGKLVRIIEHEEKGRLERWAPVIAGIPSAWEKRDE